MLVEPAGHWSVYKPIFFDHWESFQRAHPRSQTAYYDGLVAKMLGCGDPEQMGYVEHRCQQCGLGKHVVSMSCKSSLCLRCAKVLVDNWVSQVSRVTQVRKLGSTEGLPVRGSRLPRGGRGRAPGQAQSRATCGAGWRSRASPPAARASAGADRRTFLLGALRVRELRLPLLRRAGAGHS